MFTNPDEDGFWDAVAWDADNETTYILGDPVDGYFRLFSQVGEASKFTSRLPEENTSLMKGKQISAAPGESAFAASNSLLLLQSWGSPVGFVTGGSGPELILYIPDILAQGSRYSDWNRAALPLARGPSSGAFSVATSQRAVGKDGRPNQPIVVVGGDYMHIDAASGNAAVSYDVGLHFEMPDTPPHGYRSAVAWDAATKSWITVGPNGTDVSTDDGKNWSALKPDVARGEAADADRNWNALSLPFVVGPKGRIGKRTTGNSGR